MVLINTGGNDWLKNSVFKENIGHSNMKTYKFFREKEHLNLIKFLVFLNSHFRSKLSIKFDKNIMLGSCLTLNVY